MIWKCLDIRRFTTSEYHAAYQHLDDVKRARIEKTRQRKDRLRTVAADALARQMLGDGLRSACERRDRQRCSISGRIANGQDGVDGRSFHDCHADDLRGAGCASDDGIRQILTVQRENQLAGFSDEDAAEEDIFKKIWETKFKD